LCVRRGKLKQKKGAQRKTSGSAALTTGTCRMMNERTMNKLGEKLGV
jgi:hypothetical protein